MCINKFEKRKKSGDLIEAYKIMTRTEAMLAHRFFEISIKSRTRGHRHKIYNKRNWDPDE